MNKPPRWAFWFESIVRLLVYLCVAAITVIAAQNCKVKADTYQYSEKHVKAFGDRAWIADRLQKHYLSAVDAAGPNLEGITLAYREFFLRDEIAWTACLLTLHWTTDRHPDVILKHCADDEVERKWRVNLNRALVRNGYFRPHYGGGQTDIAVMHVRQINQVLRYMIWKTTKEDAKKGLIFDKHAIPKLIAVHKKHVAEQRALVEGD